MGSDWCGAGGPLVSASSWSALVVPGGPGALLSPTDVIGLDDLNLHNCPGPSCLKPDFSRI